VNHDKARDFFSAYFEGDLEPGLRQSLQAKLAADPVLQSDYSAFAETMGELGSLRTEEIESPIYLSDRIATRIDSVAPRKHASVFNWRGWATGFGLAGLAAAAIIGTGVSIAHRNSEYAMGGITPAASSSTPVDQFEFDTSSNSVTVSYLPNGAKTLVVASGTSGTELRRIPLDASQVKVPLVNKLPNPAVFELTVVGEPLHALIAIPGTVRAETKAGNGTVKELAAALAGYYRVPVAVEAADSTKAVTWNFESADPREVAGDALTSIGYSADRRPNGAPRPSAFSPDASSGSPPPCRAFLADGRAPRRRSL